MNLDPCKIETETKYFGPKGPCTKAWIVMPKSISSECKVDENRKGDEEKPKVAKFGLILESLKKYFSRTANFSN